MPGQTLATIMNSWLYVNVNSRHLAFARYLIDTHKSIGAIREIPASRTDRPTSYSDRANAVVDYGAGNNQKTG